MKQYKNTIPAEADKPCNCCGRVHRKLICIDGYWMGESCAQDYKHYQYGGIYGKDITDLYWKGYEKKFQKVERMVKG